MSLPTPLRLSINGIVTTAQWVVMAPEMNALGLITSQTARIIVRD